MIVAPSVVSVSSGTDWEAANSVTNNNSVEVMKNLPATSTRVSSDIKEKLCVRDLPKQQFVVTPVLSMSGPLETQKKSNLERETPSLAAYTTDVPSDGNGHYDDENSDWLFTEAFLRERKDQKITYDAELLKRSQAVIFLEDMGKRLEKHHVNRKIISCACVLFHRFYTFHSLLSYKRLHMAIACLFLACKIEERPYIKLKELLYAYCTMRRIELNEQDFADLRKEILLYEQILLRTINFDFRVTLPYNEVYTLIKQEFREHIGSDHINGRDGSIRQKILQECLNIVNDSYRSILCLRFSSSQMALGAVFVALIRQKIKPVTIKKAMSISFVKTKSEWEIAAQMWFDIITEKDDCVDEVALITIANTIADIYKDSSDEISTQLKNILNGIDISLLTLRREARAKDKETIIPEVSPMNPYDEESYPYGDELEERRQASTKVTYYSKAHQPQSQPQPQAASTIVQRSIISQSPLKEKRDRSDSINSKSDFEENDGDETPFYVQPPSVEPSPCFEHDRDEDSRSFGDTPESGCNFNRFGSMSGAKRPLDQDPDSTPASFNPASTTPEFPSLSGTPIVNSGMDLTFDSYKKPRL